MTGLFPPSLTELAARVVAENAAAGRKVVLAESCTGGLVCAAITEIPGSSEVLERGFVTYSNEAKIESLGVSAELIDTFGAVSVAVAWGMARGALKHSDADVAVAITGIAGPGGGSESKPVGTVVFACALRGQNENDISAEQKNFDPSLSRSEIRQEAAMVALELLLP
ncbi:MAG: competence protein [Sphingomonadales bacterium RIFCSPHIGHO2_01_FULL_65_20]|jgi:nicotinamide-nucleotide amidase|uniref:CinA family protein n=1 Tax=Blastomonas TaxID=150203 RepID=UPI000829AE19|nr:CinA family protein [Sphingomonas ursincola]MBA4779251.1 CinA family protein [Blastomonas sp.]MBY0618710.1 CinA family protein [Sphingomonas ursincola]MCH2236981.1 CinA family protein [Blastomonas sp.]OHC91813.1 MAG: competence protein [Sphingomonadales bacterium RIFCSPHIGHO2_01_FULL_65_20]